MKNLVPWLKAHWIIPVLTLIALLALPTAWYFADDMHAKDLAAYQDRVKKDADSVSDTAAKHQYFVQTVDGSGKMLEHAGPINQDAITRYAEITTEVQDKVGSVSQKGIDFNKGDHKVLVEGLFPPPQNDQVATDNLGRQFIERDIAFHKSLLEAMKAGPPAKAEDIVKALIERKSAEEARVRAELAREMNAEEQKTLAEELTGMRIASLRKRAAEISLYADATAFEGLPASVPTEAPSPAQCWDLQEKAWIDQDICKAVSTANAGATGGIPDSVVKRIVKISVKGGGLSGNDRNPQAVPFEAGEDKVPLDFNVSITGRTSGPGKKNKWYDVRNVSVEAVVSARRLPQFLNALSATNFISVIDVDLVRVEPLVDLREGFDYGDEHVVRATITLETVWLRDWRKGFIPLEVQSALGMNDKIAGEPNTTSTPAPRGRPAIPGAGRTTGGQPAGPGAAPGGRGRGEPGQD